MKKEMFKDRFSLTQAVIEGRKTMKRVVPKFIIERYNKQYGSMSEPTMMLEEYLDKHKREYYSIGEEVAVAQSYEDILLSGHKLPKGAKKDFDPANIGYRNKLYTKAEYMPYRFVVTDIRVERLQDITDGDCLNEGVVRVLGPQGRYYSVSGINVKFMTAREAFAVMYDRICGKGTWETNPYVFVYSFELIRQ